MAYTNQPSNANERRYSAEDTSVFEARHYEYTVGSGDFRNVLFVQFPHIADAPVAPVLETPGTVSDIRQNAAPEAAPRPEIIPDMGGVATTSAVQQEAQVENAYAADLAAVRQSIGRIIA